MAYDKIITIRTRLDDCLRYVQDGDKTALSRALDNIEDSGKTALDDEVILQSAINCTLETCYQDMRHTKERFGKPGGVVGYHLVHSYAPGETTPELAHEAGVEFARRLLDDKWHTCHCKRYEVRFDDLLPLRGTYSAGRPQSRPADAGASTAEPASVRTGWTLTAATHRKCGRQGEQT